MREWRILKAAALALATAAASLPLILTATPASACPGPDADGDCIRFVQGTVDPSNGLNVRTQPWGTILDTLPYNYTGTVDCYVYDSGTATYWDWIYDTRIGRSGWVADQYLYTGGNINAQVDEMSEGDCAYFSLNPPTNIGTRAISNTTVNIGWIDSTGGAAQYEITDGTTTRTTSAGTTSFNWSGLSPHQTVCLKVATLIAGDLSSWASAPCATSLNYITPAKWIPSSKSDGSSPSDPINLILTASSTISLGALYTALSGLPGRIFTDSLGVQFHEPWTRVYSPIGNLTDGHCTNAVYGDLAGSWNGEDFAAREGGCNPTALGGIGIDHFRAWQTGGSGSSYISASTEQPCATAAIPPLTHCQNSFNAGRDELFQDITTVAQSNGWTMGVWTVQPYSAGSITTAIGTAPYDGQVYVITLT
jgi:hypothetical protein